MQVEGDLPGWRDLHVAFTTACSTRSQQGVRVWMWARPDGLELRTGYGTGGPRRNAPNLRHLHSDQSYGFLPISGQILAWTDLSFHFLGPGYYTCP